MDNPLLEICIGTPEVSEVSAFPPRKQRATPQLLSIV